MQIINDTLLAELSAQARASERLRKNLNFHRSLEEKCHRFLNALEPGTVIPIHHHPTKDEGVVILKGKVRVLTYNDDGAVQEEAILCREEGRYGVDIPRNVWHAVECLEPAVLYECKEGPFIPHEQEGVLEV